MKLIEDLGLQEYGTKGARRRYGIYECPVCLIGFKCTATSINNKHTTKCRSCADIERGRNKTIQASKVFISMASALHLGVYDYTMVDYTSSRVKVVILCKEHGEFLQTPNNHLSGKGCPTCSNRQKIAAESFINDSLIVHSGKYAYSLVEYSTCSTPVVIVCSDHGLFTQTPSAHRQGSGCPKCGSTLVASQMVASAWSRFIDSSTAVHGKYYDYSLVVYTGAHNKVSIICPVHGVFQQKPHHHLSGHGCSGCATHGFDKSKPAILYYVRVSTESIVVYKIGITNRSISERFSQEIDVVRILKCWYYENGYDAYDKEQEILKQHKEHKYLGPPVLKSGNTELFTKNILNIEEVL